MLETLPASHRETLARLVQACPSHAAPALDAYLEANDPMGLESAAVLGEMASARPPRELVEGLERLHRTDAGSPLLAEETLNQLGYDLLGSKRADAAIEVFLLNTRLYPASGNACDSLAETYLASGKKDLALQYYAKALEVQPGYPNAPAAKKILETQAP